MLISVIIPTFNRSEKIGLVIEALSEQNISSKEFEILVIDNNSYDNTKEDIASHIKKYTNINIQYFFEGQQGLNFARNCGVKQAKSSIIAFLDDDAIPHSNWIKTLLDSYSDSGVGCVGGKIIPSFPGDVKLPYWLSNIFNGYFSGFDLGITHIKELTENDGFPYGANISFKKEAVISAGLFNPALDRCGKNLIAGGETEMCIRLYRMGWKILYNPHAVVHHIVSPNRLLRRYFIEHVKGEGITQVLIDYHMNNNKLTYHHLFNYLSSVWVYSKKLLKCFHKADMSFYYYLRITVNIHAIRTWFKFKILG